MKFKFSYAKEKRPNPYMGFCSFQHFRSEPLYSDLVVLPENNFTETEHVECYPIPAYVQQEGRTQGWYPDCSMAYFRFLWKEFEPREGEYRYDFIEKILNKAKENEQTLLLRIMPHSTRESDDVPLWLKEKIPCPSRPQGKRVKDSPSDPRFLTYFGRAIRALGERFDKDPALAFLDVSLPGAWGEGSDVGLFCREQLKEFAQCYLEVFQHTALIGQACFPQLRSYADGRTCVGWRADCIGPEHLLAMVDSQIQGLGDAWKTGHVSFESYWWLGEWKRRGWDAQGLFQWMLEHHVSTFNAKSLPIPWEWKETAEAFISKMGYHFVLREGNVVLNGGLKVSLLVENVGVAPIYYPLPLYLRLKSETQNFLLFLGVDVRTWLPGRHSFCTDLPLPPGILDGTYEIQIGIGGGEHPSVVFATDAPQDGDFSVLGTLSIKI